MTISHLFSHSGWRVASLASLATLSMYQSKLLQPNLTTSLQDAMDIDTVVQLYEPNRTSLAEIFEHSPGKLRPAIESE